MFDGSQYSFGGNGEYIPHGTINVTQPAGPPGASVVRLAGTGGGCVTEGPFANYTIRLDARNAAQNEPPEFFDNPRCLVRDFRNEILEPVNYGNVTDAILSNNDIASFDGAIEKLTGLHASGHIFIGGENMNLFTSPHDPAFFAHHAMLDRLWAIWQSRDPATRQYAIYGTTTFLNCKFTFRCTMKRWLLSVWKD